MALLSERTRSIAGWLYRRAENVAVILLAVMFAAFIAQIVARYLLNLPTGWSSAWRGIGSDSACTPPHDSTRSSEP